MKEKRAIGENQIFGLDSKPGINRTREDFAKLTASIVRTAEVGLAIGAVLADKVSAMEGKFEDWVSKRPLQAALLIAATTMAIGLAATLYTTIVSNRISLTPSERYSSSIQLPTSK